MRVVCTICTDQIREDFCAGPCGHTFHFACLSQWLAHQKTCPQCREKCLPRNVIKLFIDSNDISRADTKMSDPQEMQEMLTMQDSLMAHKDKALVEARESLEDIQKEMGAWQAQHKEAHKKLKREQAQSEMLRVQLNAVHSSLDNAKALKQEVKKLKVRLVTLESVETMLKGSREEVDMIVTGQKSMSNLATFIVALKRDYDVLKEKRAALVRDKSKLSEELSQAKKQLLNKVKELQMCREQVCAFEADLRSAEEEKVTLRKKVEMLQAAIDSPGSRHALKRILESPMPDHSTVGQVIDIGASPLLAGRPTSTRETDPLRRGPVAVGAKRQMSSHNLKENIIMPVGKMAKTHGAFPRPFQSSTMRTFSSRVLKNELKFAPRKSEPKSQWASKLGKLY